MKLWAINQNKNNRKKKPIRKIFIQAIHIYDHNQIYTLKYYQDLRKKKRNPELN